MFDVYNFTETVRRRFIRAKYNLAAQNNLIAMVDWERNGFPVRAKGEDAEDSDWTRLTLFMTTLLLGSHQSEKADELLAQYIKAGRVLEHKTRAHDHWARAKIALGENEAAFDHISSLFDKPWCDGEPHLSMTAGKAARGLKRYHTARIYIEPCVQPGGPLYHEVWAQEQYSQILILLGDYPAHTQHFHQIVNPRPLSKDPGAVPTSRELKFRYAAAQSEHLVSNQAKALSCLGHYADAAHVLKRLVQPGGSHAHDIKVQMSYVHALLSAHMCEEEASHVLPLIEKDGIFEGDHRLTNLCAKALNRHGRYDETITLLGPRADLDAMSCEDIKTHRRYVRAHAKMVTRPREEVSAADKKEVVRQLLTLDGYLTLMEEKRPDLSRTNAQINLHEQIDKLIRERTQHLNSKAGRPPSYQNLRRIYNIPQLDDAPPSVRPRSSQEHHLVCGLPRHHAPT